jgi:proteasome lid subunit RPN8/RPN11
MSNRESKIFSVYILEKVLNDIKSISQNFDYEIFGYLVGELFQWKSKLYNIINEHIFIEATAQSTRFSVSQMEGTAGKYEEAFQELKVEENNHNLRILGWWHTHPNIGCFLSKTDISTQKFFFPEKYQIALVVDPIRREFEFFSLNDNSTEDYRILDYAVIR